MPALETVEESDASRRLPSSSGPRPSLGSLTGQAAAPASRLGPTSPASGEAAPTLHFPHRAAHWPHRHLHGPEGDGAAPASAGGDASGSGGNVRGGHTA